MKPVKSCLASALIEIHKKSSSENKKKLESILSDIKASIERELPKPVREVD